MKYARTTNYTGNLKAVTMDSDVSLARAKAIFNAMLLDRVVDSGKHTVYDEKTSWTEYESVYDNIITIFDCDEGSFHGNAWLYNSDHSHARFVTVSGHDCGYAHITISHFYHG